jgi:predicted transcriptional regulator
MTKIEAYKAVVDGQVTEDVLEKFREMIEAHEAETEKRRGRAAEKRAEKLEGEKALEDGILAVLGEEPMTASDIAEAVEGIKTPQKATVVVKRLVAAGLAHVQDVKGKKGKVKGYTLA